MDEFPMFLTIFLLIIVSQYESAPDEFKAGNKEVKKAMEKYDKRLYYRQETLKTDKKNLVSAKIQLEKLKKDGKNDEALGWFDEVEKLEKIIIKDESEPFCGENPPENLCRKAFRNPFFESRKWELDEESPNLDTCVDRLIKISTEQEDYDVKQQMRICPLKEGPKVFISAADILEDIKESITTEPQSFFLYVNVKGDDCDEESGMSEVRLVRYLSMNGSKFALLGIFFNWVGYHTVDPGYESE